MLLPHLSLASIHYSILPYHIVQYRCLRIYTCMHLNTTCEPRHDKTNNVVVRPAKTQISLGIRQVWSESSQCTQWVAKDQSFLHVDSGCPGWSESSLGAQPRCWFCHVSAHVPLSFTLSGWNYSCKCLLFYYFSTPVPSQMHLRLYVFRFVFVYEKVNISIKIH